MSSRVTYVNGRYVPSREAVVSVEDRGNQFADAVYEACQIKDGAIIDLRRHLDRLDRSLAELRIAAPMSRAAMTHVLREVARRNRVQNGYVYWQISRGAAPRDHAFPVGVSPTFTATAKTLDVAAAALRYEKGVPVITLPDNRWERVDIKTVELGWPSGMPVVRKMTPGLWEIRSRIPEGIARVFFTVVNSRMVLLHGFVKKSQTTPRADIELALRRMKEVGT